MISIKGYIGNGQGDKEKGIEKEFSLLDLVEQVQNEKGDTIHIVIDSLGGDLDVAFAMYDYLQSLDKQIITECRNNCASAATLPFIAGDQRIAGCPIMIHNPYLTGVTGDGELLRQAAAYVEEAEMRAEKIYSERTHLDALSLSELMKSDTYMSPNQALTLGFATEMKHVVLARIDKTNLNKKSKKMRKKSGIERLSHLFRKNGRFTVYNMDLSTATGETLFVDREEGEPEVGDIASPDGSHVMPDGSTIVVAEGVITEILPAVENADAEEGTTETEDLVKMIEEILQENKALKEEIEKLKKDKNQTSEVMNALKMAGGAEKVFARFKTNYRPSARAGHRNKRDVQQNALREKINLIKEKKGDL